jgi:hypothetical protein
VEKITYYILVIREIPQNVMLEGDWSGEVLRSKYRVSKDHDINVCDATDLCEMMALEYVPYSEM